MTKAEGLRLDIEYILGQIYALRSASVEWVELDDGYGNKHQYVPIEYIDKVANKLMGQYKRLSKQYEEVKNAESVSEL